LNIFHYLDNNQQFVKSSTVNFFIIKLNHLTQINVIMMWFIKILNFAWNANSFFKLITIACNKINVQKQENKELRNAINIKELQVADNLIWRRANENEYFYRHWKRKKKSRLRWRRLVGILKCVVGAITKLFHRGCSQIFLGVTQTVSFTLLCHSVFAKKK